MTCPVNNDVDNKETIELALSINVYIDIDVCNHVEAHEEEEGYEYGRRLVPSVWAHRINKASISYVDFICHPMSRAKYVHERVP